MAIEIFMPALSPTMTEGNLAKWLKKEGERVESGAIIAEIETDKAVMELEAADDGVLAKIFIQEGEKNIKVNSVIALLAEEGEDPKDVIDNHSSKPHHDPEEKKSLDKGKTAKNHDTAVATKEVKKDRIFASPLAKRIAKLEDVNLLDIEGSGPYGRIIKADVERLINMNSNISICQNITAENSEIEVSSMRNVIAKRLVESKQTVPHFYLEITCFIDDLIKFRSEINSNALKDSDGNREYKVSVNDIIIKASALSLKKHKMVNSSWQGGTIVQYGSVDIAIAVAVNDGLMTPIIKNADQKSLLTISQEAKELAKKAKSQRLKPEEYQGGGFSISNLGMFGINRFFPIINPPQSSIMGVGNINKHLQFDDKNQVVERNAINITLSCDHRVVDGAEAALFLNTFKKFLENPSLLICY